MTMISTRPAIYKIVILNEDGTVKTGQSLYDWLNETNYQLPEVHKAVLQAIPRAPRRPIGGTYEEWVAYNEALAAWALLRAELVAYNNEELRMQRDSLLMASATLDEVFDIATYDYDTGKFVIKPITTQYGFDLVYIRISGFYKPVPLTLDESYRAIAWGTTNGMMLNIN